LLPEFTKLRQPSPVFGRFSQNQPLAPVTYNEISMTAYVYVSLKKSVLDPQGKTIQGALKKMGYKGLENVRQGKYFELTLDGGLSREEVQAEVERIAREVLTNPVIEEFRFSLAE
jgi:phosphoribosylformylglycinamidine synthase